MCSAAVSETRKNTHRTVENDAAAGEFITKGDANTGKDASPGPYAHLLERVKRSVPMQGAFFRR